MPLTEDETYKLVREAAKDELARDRGHFAYASDVLRDPHVAFPGPIWNEPNSFVREVVTVRADYKNRPFGRAEDNELSKGAALTDQAEFVARYSRRQILCEALSLAPCRLDKCPLYFRTTNPPVCREFKMAFKK